MNTTYPHIIDTYLLKTKNNRPTNKTKTIMSKSTKVEGRKKRLFSLRLKMNACRKANREAVINEAKLLQDKNVNRRKRQEDYEYLVKTWKDAMDHVGIKDDESYLVEPAFEAHRKLSKKKKKAAIRWQNERQLNFHSKVELPMSLYSSGAQLAHGGVAICASYKNPISTGIRSSDVL